jgi:creatinine amidohydrolase
VTRPRYRRWRCGPVGTAPRHLLAPGALVDPFEDVPVDEVATLGRERNERLDPLPDLPVFFDERPRPPHRQVMHQARLRHVLRQVRRSLRERLLQLRVPARLPRLAWRYLAAAVASLPYASVGGSAERGAPRSVLIEELSWPEVRVAIAGGWDTAVFACGAVEQHGPHLPTGTDTYLGTAIAERAARKAGNSLVAPTLRPGLSRHHMHFPGSFTLSTPTFVALLGEYCTSLAAHGFRRIVVFPSHGGNSDMMKAHVPDIARLVEGRAEVVFHLDILVTFQKLAEAVAEEGVTLGAAGAHAGYVETSMMLAVVPHLVDMDAAEPGRADDDFYRPENVRRSQMESFLKGVQTQSPNGILGDPTGATAEVGERLLDIAAAGLAADLSPDAAHDPERRSLAAG